MAAYLQWRRFVFFDRETVKEPPGPDGAGGKPFALPPGIAVCDSGRGSLVFGDILRGGGRRRRVPGALASVGLGGAGSRGRSGRAGPGRVESGRVCAAGESRGHGSRVGLGPLQPWECGGFLHSLALCLLKKPRALGVLVLLGCSADVCLL